MIPSFSILGGCPHSLACGPFLHVESQPHSISLFFVHFTSLSDSPLLPLSSTVKDSCDYNGATHIFRKNLPILRSDRQNPYFHSSTLIPHCHIIYYLHRFQGSGYGPLWGAIIWPTTDALTSYSVFGCLVHMNSHLQMTGSNRCAFCPTC